MKLAFAMFFLPALAFSQSNSFFRYEIDTYKNLFEKGVFNGGRSFKFTCSDETVERRTDNNKIEKSIHVFDGLVTEKTSNNGRTVESEEFSTPEDGDLSQDVGAKEPSCFLVVSCVCVRDAEIDGSSPFAPTS